MAEEAALEAKWAAEDAAAAKEETNEARRDP